MKVEWFVPARFIKIGIRQISEGDPRGQSTGGGFKVELAPSRFPIGERLSVIGTRDLDRACNRRNARRNQGRQKNRDTHVMNVWMTCVIVQYALQRRPPPIS